MRKTCYVLAVCLMCIAEWTYGQAEEFAVLYANSNQVVHTRNGQQTEAVFSGVTLPVEGQLVIKDNAYVNILYKGTKKHLEGPARYDLDKLAASILEEGKSTFVGRFWKFLSNSIHQSESPDKLERYHQQYMKNATAGIRGYGEKTFPIAVPDYLVGIISADRVAFHWTGLPQASGYVFELRDQAEQVSIFRALVKNNQLEVVLGQLALDSVSNYEWRVTAFGVETPELPMSPWVPLAYVPQEVHDFLQALQADQEYMSYDAFERPLYLAHQLEERGYLHAAFQHYQELVSSNPEKAVYQRLFASFLARMNDLNSAQGILNQ